MLQSRGQLPSSTSVTAPLPAGSSYLHFARQQEKAHGVRSAARNPSSPQQESSGSAHWLPLAGKVGLGPSRFLIGWLRGLAGPRLPCTSRGRTWLRREKSRQASRCREEGRLSGLCSGMAASCPRAPESRPGLVRTLGQPLPPHGR